MGEVITMNGGGDGVSMKGQPVANATPVTLGGAPLPVAGDCPMREQEKIGSKCCGVCCDMRRAVLIVDAIFVCLSALFLLLLSIADSQIQGMDEDEAREITEDADEVREIMEDAITVAAILCGLGVIGFAIPFYGAMKFNVPMLSYGVFWLCCDFVASMITTIIFKRKENDASETYLASFCPTIVIQAICHGLIIYPHVGLILEINKGIMSQATYPREEFSCCCSN